MVYKNHHIEFIWDEFSDKLKAFIVRRVNNKTIAEDILQDVFLKIHNSIEKLKDADRLESWIYQITRNAVIDYYRSRKIDRELPGDMVEPKESSKNSAEERLSLSIRNMVDLLPDKYKEALLLTEFNGMSQVQLAKKLGISISGAKSRVQRGRKMLKEMLLDCCHFEFDRRGTIIDYHPITCACCSSSASLPKHQGNVTPNK